MSNPLYSFVDKDKLTAFQLAIANVFIEVVENPDYCFNSHLIFCVPDTDSKEQCIGLHTKDRFVVCLPHICYSETLHYANVRAENTDNDAQWKYVDFNRSMDALITEGGEQRPINISDLTNDEIGRICSAIDVMMVTNKAPIGKKIAVVRRRLANVASRMKGVKNFPAFVKSLVANVHDVDTDNAKNMIRDQFNSLKNYAISKASYKKKYIDSFGKYQIENTAVKSAEKAGIEIPLSWKNSVTDKKYSVDLYKQNIIQYQQSIETHLVKIAKYQKKLESILSKRSCKFDKLDVELQAIQNLVREKIIHAFNCTETELTLLTAPLVFNTKNHICNCDKGKLSGAKGCNYLNKRDETWFFGRIEIKIHGICDYKDSGCQSISFRAIDFEDGEWFLPHYDASRSPGRECQCSCLSQYRQVLTKMMVSGQIASVVGTLLDFLEHVNPHSFLVAEEVIKEHHLVRTEKVFRILKGIKPNVLNIVDEFKKPAKVTVSEQRKKITKKKVKEKVPVNV